MNRFLTIAVVMALAMLLVPAGMALAQSPDPLKVLEAYDLALKAHDVDGALALFADDAVLTTRQGQFVGKEQIRLWLGGLVAQNDHIEVAGRQAEGDKVTWQNKFFRADLPSLSNEPLEAQAEAVIESGKIKTFSSVLTDDSQAKLDAAIAKEASAPATDTAAPAQDTTAPATPAQLPSTGGVLGSVLSLSAIFMGGGVLLVAIGLAIGWGRRRVA